MLQLSVLLVGLCQAHRAPPPGGPSTSQGAGVVPVSQLRMLSLGLAHLLQGVEENAQQLEQQGGQVAAELDGATKSLESLLKQSLKAGRTHRQVRNNTFYNRQPKKQTFPCSLKLGKFIGLKLTSIFIITSANNVLDLILLV